MGDRPFADLAEAKELLMTLHKQAISSPDQSILRALIIVLTDYIQRGRQAMLDAERLSLGKEREPNLFGSLSRLESCRRGNKQPRIKRRRTVRKR